MTTLNLILGWLNGAMVVLNCYRLMQTWDFLGWRMKTGGLLIIMGCFLMFLHLTGVNEMLKELFNAKGEIR